MNEHIVVSDTGHVLSLRRQSPFAGYRSPMISVRERFARLRNWPSESQLCVELASVGLVRRQSTQ
jgi:hypothetical protein